MNSYYVLIISLALLASTCQNTQSTDNNALPSSTTEAREDSLSLAAAYAAQARINEAVYPDIETSAIQARNEEDAADDPAIWVHPTERERSLVFGSNKRGGLAAYDLRGNEVAYYPIGSVNNVDLLYGFPLGDSLVTILGCSNRSDQSVDLFLVDNENGQLTNIAIDALSVDSMLIDDIYGFCFAHHQDSYYVTINGKNGCFQQFQLVVSKHKLDLELVRTLQFDSQTEGMVADSYWQQLYVGEEGRGIWRLAIDPNTGDSKSLLTQSDSLNPNIRYDIEGLSIYSLSDSTGYLIASSQGNFSYSIFERTPPNAYRTSFKIEARGGIDGVEETDGLDLTSDSLSALFPKGMLVVQDGFNYSTDNELIPQNFKYVDWRAIEDLLLSQVK